MPSHFAPFRTLLGPVLIFGTRRFRFGISSDFPCFPSRVWTLLWALRTPREGWGRLRPSWYRKIVAREGFPWLPGGAGVPFWLRSWSLRSGTFCHPAHSCLQFPLFNELACHLWAITLFELIDRNRSYSQQRADEQTNQPTDGVDMSGPVSVVTIGTVAFLSSDVAALAVLSRRNVPKITGPSFCFRSAAAALLRPHPPHGAAGRVVLYPVWSLCAQWTAFVGRWRASIPSGRLAGGWQNEREEGWGWVPNVVGIPNAFQAGEKKPVCNYPRRQAAASQVQPPRQAWPRI